MPFSLNLPHAVCWPLVRRIRREQGAIQEAMLDPSAYFRRQYETTGHVAERFMQRLAFADQFILDVGGGLGGRMPWFFDRGARAVWCIDINREELAQGAAAMRAQFPQYADRTRFLHPDDVPDDTRADLALLVDSFEHLLDPAAVLAQCHRHLRPGGRLWIGSIGWYNYMASHCLWHVPIPWCQVLFSEHAILETIRSLLHSPGYRPVYWEIAEGLDRWNGVKHLRDRPGEPLNQLSLRKIRRVLAASPFVLESFQLYPIAAERAVGKLVRPLLHLPGFDELLHGYYTAILRKP